LLARYWASGKYWYAVQPLHVIYHYYGSEVAFRFAWLGYYNKMLILISIIGVLIFCYSFIILHFREHRRLQELCTSEIIMCPTCMWEQCTFKKLKDYCSLSRLTYLVDNWASIVYAIMVSIWATFFVEYWKRRESKLKFSWNLMGASVDIEQKPEFEENTPYRRISETTGVLEAYIPLSRHILHYTVSSLACFLIIVVVVITVLATMVTGKVVRTSLKLMRVSFFDNNINMIHMTVTSIISVIFIRLFDPVSKFVICFKEFLNVLL
ncbi:hypothetical protein Trydic_g10114, partial [Trypoxylus dichotomus]